MSGHRFRVGDATGAVAALLQGERVSIFYTDPPWGPGKMKYFEQLAEKAGHPVPARDYRDLLRDVAQQATQYTDGPVFIEYGKQWRAEVQEICRSVNLTPLAVIDVPYGNGGVLNLHILKPEACKVDMGRAVQSDYLSSIANSGGGLKAVLTAIEPFVVKGGIMLDPCCGYGIVAKAAKKVGMRFFGNELNPTRLKRAKDVVPQ